jgi:hypothetical protein
MDDDFLLLGLFAAAARARRKRLTDEELEEERIEIENGRKLGETIGMVIFCITVCFIFIILVSTIVMSIIY